MTNDDLALARAAIRTLLAANPDDAAAWDAFVNDGWERLLVSEDEMGMPAAVIAVGEVARATRGVPLVGSLAASALLSEHDADPGGAVTVGVDATRLDDSITFTLLDCKSNGAAVVGPVEGKLLLADVSSCDGGNPSIDLTRSIAHVDVPIAKCQELPSGPDSTDRHLARLALLLAADALGAVEEAVDRTVRYACDRQVFGAPLASLQVVQHQLVDMLLAARLGRRLVDKAASRAGAPDGGLLAWSAKAFMSEKGPRVTGQAIQLHGGMGFSWESGMHRLLRRTEGDRGLLGSQAHAAMEALRHARDRPRTAVTDFLLESGAG